MIYECANAFYFANINKIGGVESHFYYMARKYGNYDIIIFYRHGDQEQIDRLRRFVPCIQLDKRDRVKCKKIFVNYVRDILEQCDAEEKIFVLHADYKDLVARGIFTRNILPIDKRIDKYVGVSQLVCDSWKEMTGIDAENLYQPVIVEKLDTKPLMFISATRLTKEKGWNRMEKLAKAMDANGVNYTWLVYTDSKNKSPSKNMIFCQPRLDVTLKMGGFDAYIQLSDNEGYCLSVVEALMQSVPIICTDLPVLRELGVNDSNAIILDFDMKNIPIEAIENINKKKFTYDVVPDRWDDILIHDETKYDGKMLYLVRALGTFKKLGLKEASQNRIPNEGDTFVINADRLWVLSGHNRYHQPFVEVIEKIKPRSEADILWTDEVNSI